MAFPELVAELLKVISGDFLQNEMHSFMIHD